jgi:hypothetical protein
MHLDSEASSQTRPPQHSVYEEARLVVVLRSCSLKTGTGYPALQMGLMMWVARDAR